MPGTSPQGGGLRRSLSVWQAIGPSIALMAPSMAAPGFARRLGAALTASEGIGAPGSSTASAFTQLPAGGASGDHTPRA
jgi:hypothetical protein